MNACALHRSSWATWDPRGRRAEAARDLSRGLWMASLIVTSGVALSGIVSGQLGLRATGTTEVAPELTWLPPPALREPPAAGWEPRSAAAAAEVARVIPVVEALESPPVDVSGLPGGATDVASPGDVDVPGTAPAAVAEGTGQDGGGSPPFEAFPEEFPSLLHAPAPPYPGLAREAGVDGTVVLEVLVGVDGRVDDVRVMRGIPLLDAAATEAVRGWRYTPARSAGRAVRTWVRQPVRFRLHG